VEPLPVELPPVELLAVEPLPVEIGTLTFTIPEPEVPWVPVDPCP
jgi:hypothetical protein